MDGHINEVSGLKSSPFGSSSRFQRVESHQDECKMKEQYVFVSAACEHQTFRCIVLSDDEHLTIPCTIPKLSKGKFHVAPGQILRVDTQDLEKQGGTADILEIISDTKELRHLRKCGLIPAEDAMPQLNSAKPAHAVAAACVSSAQRRVGTHAHDKRVAQDDDVARRNEASSGASENPENSSEAGAEIQEEDVPDVDEDDDEKLHRLTKSEKRKIRDEAKRVELEKKKKAPNLEKDDDEKEMDLDDL